MKMSDKRKSELYDCIANPIENFRLKLIREKRQATDAELFRLQSLIWKQVHRCLKLDGPA